MDRLTLSNEVWAASILTHVRIIKSSNMPLFKTLHFTRATKKIALKTAVVTMKKMSAALMNITSGWEVNLLMAVTDVKSISLLL